MAEDPFSLLREAILQKRRVTFRLGGAVFNLAPYVLYDLPNGALMLGGLADYGRLWRVNVAEIEDLAATTRHFNPDPTFDLADPEYSQAHAAITGV
jgi:hypothetical protein